MLNEGMLACKHLECDHGSLQNVVVSRSMDTARPY